jgi:hypothetical protein
MREDARHPDWQPRTLEQEISELCSIHGYRKVLETLAAEFTAESEVQRNSGNNRGFVNCRVIANELVTLAQDCYPNPVPDYIPPQGV